ncbi:hypothetical protein [Bacteroides caecigallinarum]|uniref:hypothetical protein n=1 Tax=Bacteroides caecigallinarum TaxID=1411144 RepID=UPI001F35BE66|nr:hypothetical protein [Bacteroides caecigallinarum]MCF2583249.1 hypothetical protein [Bacteroides caecigallinarum]
MATKTVISKVLDAEAVDGIIEFPQNKTLYVDQFTDMAPVKPGDVFQPETMEDVFNFYKPEKKNVQMLDLEGKPVKENFKFNAIKDFDDKELIKQSPYLAQQKSAVDSYKTIEQQLIKNKILRRAYENEESRKHLIVALQALLAELEKN